MRVPFRLLDVFTEVPFAGNQLCVVPNAPVGLDTATMRALAREINFSETTFVTASREDGYDVRIFTPVEEVPFAGHPTLGTAFALASLGLAGTSLLQRSAAGEVPVEVDLEGRRASMIQLPPVFAEPFEDRERVARACGVAVSDLRDDLPIRFVTTGLGPLIIPLRDEAALRKARRADSGLIKDLCDASGAFDLYPFAVRGPGHVVARMFDWSDEIGEDPATGSAAGPLGAYLAEHDLAGMPGRCVVAQGEVVGRPSSIHVDVSREGEGWKVRVGGGVQMVGEGAFEF